MGAGLTVNQVPSGSGGSTPSQRTKWIDMGNNKIESVAFSMWLSKYGNTRGPQDQWLTYWEHYDVWVTHEKRQTYIDHVKRSIELWAKSVKPKNSPGLSEEGGNPGQTLKGPMNG